ncbi:MAG TPA: glycosyltransferase family 1 protein [Aliidongia sp.]|nr:glycosyltransferase family 1 protein [Aliidongia sp.]
MLRVLFDDEIFSTQFEGGVSRYFTELIEELPRAGVTPLLPFRLTCNRHLMQSPAFPGWRMPRFAGSRTLLRGLNRRLSLAALDRGRYEVWHASWYDGAGLPHVRALPDKRVVTTVYDMTPEIMPEAIPAGIGDPHAGKRAMAEAADMVVAISAATKADLLRFTATPADRVRVIHLGVGEGMRWDPGAARAQGLPDRFLLFVGKRAGYKNFAGVAPALATLLRQNSDLHLICVGSGPLSEAEAAPFAAIAGRVRQIQADDRTLAWCYAHAAAFVFPSRYEGFGLPILEAFLNHCPTVLAERSCFPEIGCEAALYFDPDRPDELVDLLGRLIGDEAQRRRLGEAGALRVRDFTWARTAQAHAALYRELT